MSEDSSGNTSALSGVVAGANKHPFLEEQVRLLYERVPIGLIATGINALFVAAVLWDTAVHRRLIAWLLCQWLFVILRYAFYRKFLTLTLTPAVARHWRDRFTLGVGLSGLLWGLSGVILWPTFSMAYQAFLALVLGGMVAGATGAFAAVVPAFLSFAIPALAPIIVVFLFSGEFFGVAAGLMVLLFGALTTWTTVRNHDVIITSLRRHFEKADLIQSLVQEKSRTEILNKELLSEIEERKCIEQELLQHRDHLEELVAERSENLKETNEKLREEIAGRIRFEKQLQIVAREWTATFDTMSDFISIIDCDFKFLRVNRALANFLSKDPKDIIGKPCYELIHGRSEPWPECPHIPAIQKNKTVTTEVNDPHVGLPLLVTCTPYKDENGKIIGTVHTARDISEQKRAELAKEELIAELQQAMANIKMLSGLLPICASCKKIRDDKGYWNQIESYLTKHSEAEFSHGICPDCMKELYPEFVGHEDEKG